LQNRSFESYWKATTRDIGVLIVPVLLAFVNVAVVMPAPILNVSVMLVVECDASSRPKIAA
jgi:hypothetical protein